MTKGFARELALSVSVVFLASAIFGQEADKKTPVPTAPVTGCESETCISKVLYLPNVSTPSELQNLVGMLRAIADIKQIRSNPSESTISLEGTPEQIVIAEKLVSVLEKVRSSGGNNPSFIFVHESKPSLLESAMSEKGPASRNRCELNSCVIEVLYLPTFSTAYELQDVVNMVRTLSDITRLVPNQADHTITIKATAEQLATAEELVRVLENLRSSGGHDRTSVLVYELKLSMPPPPSMSAETRQRLLRTMCELTTCYIKALYVPDFSMDQLQDVLNRIRTTTQITRTVPSQSRHVIVIRGTAEQVALAEKLANE